MTPRSLNSLILRGGSVLHPDGRLTQSDVVCLAGQIDRVEPKATADGAVVDATNALVLPGIVDVHGDAFERAVMPRGGVFMDLPLAIAETRPQLLAAGITTAFVSVTDGWEPGLRSRDTLRALVAHVTGEAAQRRSPRLLIHVRHECCNTKDIDELERWIRSGALQMLSFNDHTPGGIHLVKGITPLQVSRSGLDRDALKQRQVAAISQRDVGQAQERDLAELAREHNVTTASHDAHSSEDFERDNALGVGIAEFPTSIELALRYRTTGAHVLLGAPNLVRGRSHLGNLSVRDAWKAGAADMLCSDYHYPSILQAPFVLQTLGVSLSDAWAAVSRTPAEAAGLVDRGFIAPGATADLVVVEPPRGEAPARVRAVVVGGELASLAP